MAADFNADGMVDLAAGGDSCVSVLLGNGNGFFGTTQNYNVGNGSISDLAVADFNGDGIMDLITTNTDAATASVLLGSGTGSFKPPVTVAVGSSPRGVAVGDFNGDGWADAVSANAGTNTVSVLINDQSWAAPPPYVSISDATITEGNTGPVNATFTLTLSNASAVDVTLNYATGNGTATAGSDYTAASGAVTIPAGLTTKTFTVAVLGDRSAEPTENFVVNLSAATNGLIVDSQGVGTIFDNEPRISISDVTKAEGKKGTTTLFAFTVTLSAPYDQAVTMSFRTVNGTATTGDGDYIAKTGTLTFAPGETAKTITIEVKGDSKRQAGETFYLDLFGLSSNGLFTKSRGVGTILNDD